MNKWVGKLSFILTGIGFIIAGVFAPDAWPTGVELLFGGVGVLLAYLGGWFKSPSPPE